MVSTIVFLVATMLSMGLRVTEADLLEALWDRRWMEGI